MHLVTEISAIADEVSLIQARARAETDTVQEEHIDPDEALDIARANRLDWMNNRASLVDTWRWVLFNANKMRADLNVVFNGNMNTVGNSPARFRAPTGTFSVGLQFNGAFYAARGAKQFSPIDHRLSAGTPADDSI